MSDPDVIPLRAREGAAAPPRTLRTFGLAAVARAVCGDIPPADPAPEVAFLLEHLRAVDRGAGWMAELASQLAAPAPDDQPLVRLAREIGLTPIEVLAVALAAAVEEDAMVGRALAHLQAPLGGSRPTLSLLAACLGPAAPHGVRPLDAIATGNAVRSGLLTVLGDALPLPERTAAVPLHLCHALAGFDGWWPGGTIGTGDVPRVPLPPSFAQEAERQARALTAAPRQALVLRASAGGEGRAVACAVAEAAGRRALFIETESTAGLGPWLVLRDLLPVFVAELGPGERRVLPLLSGYLGPMMALCGPDGSVESAAGTALAWTLAVPPRAEREALWTQALGAPELAAQLARDHRHGSGRIAHLGRLARQRGMLEGRAEPTRDDVLGASRSGDGSGLNALAQPLPASIPDEALVVGPALRTELDMLLLRCRMRDGLTDGLGVSASVRYTPGVRALFVGPVRHGQDAGGGVAGHGAGPAPLPGRSRLRHQQVHRRDGEEPGAAAGAGGAGGGGAALRRGGFAVRQADGGARQQRPLRQRADQLPAAAHRELRRHRASSPATAARASTRRSRGGWTPSWSSRCRGRRSAARCGRRTWASGHALQPRDLNRLAATADLGGGHIRNAVLAAAVVAQDAGRPIEFGDVAQGWPSNTASWASSCRWGCGAEVSGSEPPRRRFNAPVPRPAPAPAPSRHAPAESAASAVPVKTGVPLFLRRASSAPSASPAGPGEAPALPAVAPESHPSEAEAERVEQAVASGEAESALAGPELVRAPASAAAGSSDGAPLPADVRARIEPVVGADLGHVRVHDGPDAHAAAKALSARAFAQGSDVFLGEGEHASDAPLMAHEAVHTLHPDGAVHRKPAAAPRLRGETGGRRTRARRTERASGLPRPERAPTTAAPEADPAPVAAAPDATGSAAPDASGRGTGAAPAAPQESGGPPPSGAAQPDADFSARSRRVMDQEVGEVVANPDVAAERPRTGRPSCGPPARRPRPAWPRRPPPPRRPPRLPRRRPARPRPPPVRSRRPQLPPSPRTPPLKPPRRLPPPPPPVPSPRDRPRRPPSRTRPPRRCRRPRLASCVPCSPTASPPARSSTRRWRAAVIPSSRGPRRGPWSPSSARTRRAARRSCARRRKRTAPRCWRRRSRARRRRSPRWKPRSRRSARTAPRRARRCRRRRPAARSRCAPPWRPTWSASTPARASASPPPQRSWRAGRRRSRSTRWPSRRVPALAAEEADRADGELERNAVEAEQAGENEASRHPGSDDPRPDQRTAARQVGRESAADIRDKKPALRADLLERAEGFGGRYTELSDAVVAQIADAADQLVPALEDAAERAAERVRAGGDAALQGLESRLAADLAALDAAEQGAAARIRAGGEAAAGRLRDAGGQAAGEVDAILGTVLASVDAGVDEAAAVVEGESMPLLAGMADVVAGARNGVEGTISAGRGQLSAGVAQGMATLAESAAAAGEQVRGLGEAGRAAADDVRAAALPAMEQAAARRQEEADGIVTALAAEHEGTVTSVMAEVDRAVEQARGEIRGINDQLRGELHTAAEESISQAVLPRTDDTETRSAAAAAQQNESWAAGLWRAAVELAKGLIIMVVVALVVAAIAAAFGVLLTAWTAVMIAGAILLAVGLVMSIIHRSSQKELGGNPLAIVGLAVLDVTGVTGIYEGIRGKDIVTGDPLNDAQRTERGVLGAVTAISLIAGVRSFRAGPPGGAYVRPGSIPFSWRTVFTTPFRETLGRMGSVVKDFGVGLYEVVTTGTARLYESVRARLGMEPSAGLKERLGAPSRVKSDRASEVPYERPESARVIGPDAPLDVTKLDPSQRYLWVADAQGRMHLVPEGMRFDPVAGEYVYDPTINPGHGTGNPATPGGRPVKHGDVTPGPEGAYRGEARAGGELMAERGPDGNPTGRWIIDDESSYTAVRQQVTPGPAGEVRVNTPPLEGESVAAAIEVLRANGSDVSNIVPKNSWGGDAPHLPPPPAEVPTLPPVVRPIPGAGQRPDGEEAHAPAP